MLYEVITGLRQDVARGRGGRPRAVRRACVITSYSIHYTKLYEVGDTVAFRNSNESYTVIALDVFDNNKLYALGEDGVKHTFIRITSYNVCYTKLLRC